jgi:nucleotide-binding universal stress UspA family protein
LRFFAIHLLLIGSVILSGCQTTQNSKVIAGAFNLIVMGSHGRKGFQKMILGSFAQDVLGASEIPVLIVKK